LPAVIPVSPKSWCGARRTLRRLVQCSRRAALVARCEQRAERMEARFMRELGERIRRDKIAAIHVGSRHDP
jgi:hypothetical protein